MPPLPSADAENAAIFEGLPADLRALFDYMIKRAGRKMPRSRSDLDPSEIKMHLPSMILVDVLYDVAEKPTSSIACSARTRSTCAARTRSASVADAFFGPTLENAGLLPASRRSPRALS